MRLTEEDKSEFQDRYPQMRVVPSADLARVYEGDIHFRAHTAEWGEVDEIYQLRIRIDLDPETIPTVWETGGRIPHVDANHVNPDGSLCLGSFLQLRLSTGRPFRLVPFVDKCLVPFLYAMSLRARGVPQLVFGELKHGPAGLLEDYARILGLKQTTHVVHALDLVAKRYRVANKSACPCGCRQRLGKCEYRHRLHEIRRSVPRRFLSGLTKGMRPAKSVDIKKKQHRV